MGDRAMAEIIIPNGRVYFYTHWGGSELPDHAQIALNAAQPRINDYSYALRIVLDRLIQLSGSRDQETGSGIMLSPDAEDEYNNNKPSVIIDLVKNKVFVDRLRVLQDF